MSILDKLAHSLGRNDEVPNQLLAKEIATANDAAAVAELIENLQHKNKAIQSDCLKTLYEIGYLQPTLIADHEQVFLDLLGHNNNRFVWGAMIALDEIARVRLDFVYYHLPQILDVAEKGSVIVKDHAVGILIKLCAFPPFSANCLPLLLDFMKDCPSNQFPKYAEDALPIVTEEYKREFAQLLTDRLDDCATESKRKRVEKVLKNLSKK